MEKFIWLPVKKFDNWKFEFVSSFIKCRVLSETESTYTIEYIDETRETWSNGLQCWVSDPEISELIVNKNDLRPCSNLEK